MAEPTTKIWTKHHLILLPLLALSLILATCCFAPAKLADDGDLSADGVAYPTGIVLDATTPEVQDELACKPIPGGGTSCPVIWVDNSEDAVKIKPGLRVRFINCHLIEGERHCTVVVK